MKEGDVNMPTYTLGTKPAGLKIHDLNRTSTLCTMWKCASEVEYLHSAGDTVCS